MREQDQLSEFTVLKKRPRNFYIVFIALLIITCFATIPVFLYLRNILTGTSEITLTPIVLFAVITAYPILGCYGFYHLKKYGWIICSHYTLSATLIIVGLILSGQFSMEQALKIICEFLIGISSLYSIINLFRKKYLEAFIIDKSYIFLAVMLTILFPLFWFGILITVDRMN